LGEVLRFTRVPVVADPNHRGPVRFMPERWGTLNLETGEQQGTPFPPEVVQALELGPGGSLAGATTEEVQAAALAANPMRRVLELGCTICDHQWIAPALGACPRCHAGQEFVVNHGEHINMAQRLK
jgi:hypothetical protein